MAQHWSEGVGTLRFTSREYQQELIEIGCTDNLLACPPEQAANFVALKLLQEMAYQIRPPSKKKSVFITQPRKLKCLETELEQLTDLKITSLDATPDGLSSEAASSTEGHGSWSQAMEGHQVLVVVSAVLCEMLTMGELAISDVNLLVIDECHSVTWDTHLQQIMSIYSTHKDDKSNVDNIPRVVAFSYPLFTQHSPFHSNNSESTEANIKRDYDDFINNRSEFYNECSPGEIKLDSPVKSVNHTPVKSRQSGDSDKNKSTSLSCFTESCMPKEEQDEDYQKMTDFNYWRMDGFDVIVPEIKKIEDRSSIYDKLEYQLEKLEKMLNCKADMAADIVGLKKITGKPREVLLESVNPDADAYLCSKGKKLKHYMKTTVFNALVFLDDHRYDPMEIYGDDAFGDELRAIPNPILEPRDLLYQLLHVLDQAGPYAADKAAFMLLIKIEKLKVKIPYERHFLLLCLVTSVLLQIRSTAEIVFEKFPTETERIRRFTSPKVLRLMDIFKLFKPKVKPNLERTCLNADVKDENEVVQNVESVSCNGFTDSVVLGNDTIHVYVDEASQTNSDSNAITSDKQSSQTTCDSTDKISLTNSTKSSTFIDHIDSCDFQKLESKIEQKCKEYSRESGEENILNKNEAIVVEATRIVDKLVTSADQAVNFIVGKDINEKSEGSEEPNKCKESLDCVVDDVCYTKGAFETLLQSNSYNHIASDKMPVDEFQYHAPVDNFKMSETLSMHNKTADDLCMMDTLKSSPRKRHNDGGKKGRKENRPHNWNDPDSLCGLIFVDEPLMAKILYSLVYEYSKSDPELQFISAQFIVDKTADPQLESKEAESEHKLQEEVLRRFRMHECNLLIGTSVLEDGMDLPKCNLVIRWDPPKGYRSYAQCRSRARAPKSLYALMSPGNPDKLITALAHYAHIERMLVSKCKWSEPGPVEEAKASSFTPLILPYRPQHQAVTLSQAVQLVNRYCAKLPSDTFTRLVPLWSIEEISYRGHTLYVCSVRLPINSPLKYQIVGHPMPSVVLARRIAALQVCRALHLSGELDDNLLPIGKESFRALEPDWMNMLPASDNVLLSSDAHNEPRPGTTKRKQYYYKKIAKSLTGCRPVLGQPCLAYEIRANLAVPLPERHNTRGRKLHPPENYLQGFCILTSKPMHQVPVFPLFTRSGEIHVELVRMPIQVVMSRRRCRLVNRFMKYTFKEVLRIHNHLMVFNPGKGKKNNYYVVPTDKVTNPDGSTSVVVDWDFLELIYEHTEANKDNYLEDKNQQLDAIVESNEHTVGEEITNANSLENSGTAVVSNCVNDDGSSDSKYLNKEIITSKEEINKLDEEEISKLNVEEKNKLNKEHDILNKNDIEIIKLNKCNSEDYSTINNCVNENSDLDKDFSDEVNKLVKINNEELKGKVNECHNESIKKKDMDDTSDKCKKDQESEKNMEGAQTNLENDGKIVKPEDISNEVEVMWKTKDTKASSVKWDELDENDEANKKNKRKALEEVGTEEPEEMPNPYLAPGEVFQFDFDKYRDAVVTPWYRNQNQPQYFYVAEICLQLTPLSAFPSSAHPSFMHYYHTKYGVTITQMEQPLLDVDHTSARLNLLTPRFVNRKGVALPTSSERTKRAKRELLEQKQILVPELCCAHPFRGALWRAAVTLPCVLYRINSLLLADEIRRSVATRVSLGKTTPPANFSWPPLDFGWSLADVLKEKGESNLQKEQSSEECLSKKDGDKCPSAESCDEEGYNSKDESSVLPAEEDREKTANEIVMEGEKLNESGDMFEVGTWSNDMASSVPLESDEDVFTRLPGNVTMCPNTNDLEWNASMYNQSSRRYSIAGSDNSYISSDMSGGETNSEDDDDFDDATQKDNEKGGLRIEFKSGNEAEAIEIPPAVEELGPEQQDDLEAKRLEEIQSKEMFNNFFYAEDKGDDDPDMKKYIEDYQKAIKSNEEEILRNGTLIKYTEPMTNIKLKDYSENIPFHTPKHDNYRHINKRIDYLVHSLRNNSSKYLETIQQTLGNNTSKKPEENVEQSLKETVRESFNNLETNKEETTMDLLNEDQTNPFPDIYEKAMSKDEIVELFKDMFPYENVPSDENFDVDSNSGGLFKNGGINLDDLEDSKRRILNEFKSSLPSEEWRKYNMFAMKDFHKDDTFDQDYEDVRAERIAKEIDMIGNGDSGCPVGDNGDSNQTEYSFSFDYQPDLKVHPGPSPSIILQALTMSNANDGINLERLETVGDSFLKYAITVYLYCSYPNIHEGKLSYLRSKQVSNLNLYRLGRRRHLGGRMVACKFEPHDNWLPPCHKVPAHLERALIHTHIPSSLWNVADMPSLDKMSREEVERLVYERIMLQHVKQETEGGATPATTCHSGATTATMCHSGVTAATSCHSGVTAATSCHSGATTATTLHSVATPATTLHSDVGGVGAMDQCPTPEVRETDAEKEGDRTLEEVPCFVPYNLITQHSIPDKSIADCVEALIGAYLIECGPRGALLFMAWLGIRVLPKQEILLDRNHPFIRLMEEAQLRKKKENIGNTKEECGGISKELRERLIQVEKEVSQCDKNDLKYNNLNILNDVDVRNILNMIESRATKDKIPIDKTTADAKLQVFEEKNENNYTATKEVNAVVGGKNKKQKKRRKKNANAKAVVSEDDKNKCLEDDKAVIDGEKGQTDVVEVETVGKTTNRKRNSRRRRNRQNAKLDDKCDESCSELNDKGREIANIDVETKEDRLECNVNKVVLDIDENSDDLPGNHTDSNMESSDEEDDENSVKSCDGSDWSEIDSDVEEVWCAEDRDPGSLMPHKRKDGSWVQIIFGELKAPPSPLLRYVPDPEGELMQMLSGYDELERTLKYRFKDRSYLLQAMTHASHTHNRLTDCYQRLEFLGDAVLDYLITRQLYEDPRRHSPGPLTDLRSALVNNTIFASLAVRHGMHKFFRHLSPGLNEVLSRFVKIQEENGHSISEEHYLIQEDECEQAEDVEVPKALGDLFESIAGAIFLDSGMSLDAVWKVYYALMHKEMELFSETVPKSPVRELLEMEPETTKFGKPEKLADGRRVRVTVEVLGVGAFKGVGRNFRIAKCTAAKCALRHLNLLKGKTSGVKGTAKPRK